MSFDGLSFSQWLSALNAHLERRYHGAPIVKLTENFLDTELGVAGCDIRLIGNATFLCERVLEPVRAHYGQPVIVHDGYRDLEHNERVGGKPDSWHLFNGGHAAADFHVMNVPLQETFDWMRLESKIPFDKVILEHTGGIPRTIHVQIDCLQGPRRQAFVGGTGDSHDYQPVTVA